MLRPSSSLLFERGSRESVSGVPGYFGCTEQITVENRMNRVRVSVPQISVFTHKIAVFFSEAVLYLMFSKFSNTKTPLNDNFPRLCGIFSVQNKESATAMLQTNSDYIIYSFTASYDRL